MTNCFEKTTMCKQCVKKNEIDLNGAYGFFQFDLKFCGRRVNDCKRVWRTRTMACLRSLQVFVNK